MTANENNAACVAVVTGASAGIGKAAAKALAGRGWQVIGLGRNPERSKAALAEIREHAPGSRVEMVVADLAVMAEAARAAREIAALTDKVHALLNNAGGIGKEKVVTVEGNEAVFAGNHLGHFLLTRELLPLLRAAVAESGPGQVRIVNVSSSASDLAPGFNWDDVQMLVDHRSSPAYCNVKLANLMFTRSLAKRLQGDGIIVNAMHPGVVATNFASYGDDETKAIVASLKDVTVTPEEGADTLVWLATGPSAGSSSGGYFYRREPTPMNKLALDDEAAERLWVESEAIIARSLKSGSSRQAATT